MLAIKIIPSPNILMAILLNLVAGYLSMTKYQSLAQEPILSVSWIFCFLLVLMQFNTSLSKKFHGPRNSSRLYGEGQPAEEITKSIASIAGV